MKLFRFGNIGDEHPGVFRNNKMLDVSVFGEDFDERFFANDGIQRLELFVNLNAESLVMVPEKVRLASPVCCPSKLICIGLNYIDHALETNSLIPKEPIIFFKSTTAICGPNDDLVIPKDGTKTDWEVELGVVIGKKVSYTSEETAMQFVAGYVLHNDYSERSFQLERGGQWVKGKSCDSFGPIGPYLVTPDEVKDVNNLNMWLKVNGITRQNSSTSQLIFKIPFIIHYVSQFMTLLPGDIISTGTPHGVGIGMNPPQFLQPGDEVELGIDYLGASRQKVKGYKSAME